MAVSNRATRLVSRPAKRAYRTLRSERRTLRQGSVALLLSTAAAFVAGLTLGHITGTLDRTPGLLTLIPASVGMRGTIFGSIGARLGTATHAGLFEVSFRRGTVLRRNTEVAVITTLTSSVLIAVLAQVMSSAFGTPTVSMWDLISISVVGSVIGSGVILVVTMGMAVVSYRRGYDLDAVATPLITAIGDMVSIPALFLAAYITRIPAVNASVATIGLVAAASALVLATRVEAPTRRILLEMAPVLVLVPLLDILAGALLESRRASFAPALLLIVPPFISQAGALGGILSARLSSKLQVGIIAPRAVPEHPARGDGVIVSAFGAMVFALIGVVGYGLAAATGLDPPPAATAIGGTLLAGLFTLPVLLAASYYIAIGTTTARLDPDNYGVPVITGLMDLVGIVCLLMAMSLLGVANG